MPFLPTMQPKLVEAPPAGDWIHEIKYDGYRTQFHVEGGAARAFTRNGHDWTAKYAPIVEAAALLPLPAIIDGEMCVADERGATDFGALRSAIGHEPHRLVFFAFDLLSLNGVDLRNSPLGDRRELLADLIQDHAPDRIILSQEFDGDGQAFFAAADAAGLEGIVSKRKGSRYLPGHSDHWLKTKCWATASLDVVGVEQGDDGLPYALLAREGEYTGAALLTLPKALRDPFWQFVDRQKADAPRLAVRRKRATWLRPGLVASVKHLKGAGKLRHATVSDVHVTV